MIYCVPPESPDLDPYRCVVFRPKLKDQIIATMGWDAYSRGFAPFVSLNTGLHAVLYSYCRSRLLKIKRRARRLV